MTAIILTSESTLKREAVARAFPGVEIVCRSTAGAAIPTQPINSGAECARLRTLHVKGYVPADLIISIENEIQHQNDQVADVCHVRIETADGEVFLGHSEAISLPSKYLDKAQEKTPDDYPLRSLGSAATLGSCIGEEFPEIDSANWMADPRFGGLCRSVQIDQAMRMALQSMVRAAIIRVEDFPKPNVVFQDLSKVLIQPHLLSRICEDMVERVKDLVSPRVKVMGLDARGFIYGTMVAMRLHVGFVMARKKGKLPGETVEVSYGTEYSRATLEVMTGLISPGDEVLIVDDLVATGGSLEAAVQLVRRCGGTALACLTVLQVDSLVAQARARLAGIPLLVTYE